MKYLITGASGLIGKKLVNKLLEQNASINILTTNKNLKSSNKNINKFYWNPELNKIDSNPSETLNNKDNGTGLRELLRLIFEAIAVS